MARYVKRVTVYNSTIAGMFTPGGEINKEATSFTIRVKAVAEATAPKRTGHLAASHRRSVVPSGIYGTRGYVENRATQAEWVHDGVNHPIVAKHLNDRLGRQGVGKMRLRAGGGYPVSFQRVVRGQAAQPWLAEAFAAVLSEEGY